jgi:hypothetical protein
LGERVGFDPALPLKLLDEAVHTVTDDESDE